jgi:GntR family transcriptional regulator
MRGGEQMNAWDSFSTEFNDKSPIYSQIIASFSRSFARGNIKPGERIPSIRDMALQLKVNANTMQRVYQEMERGGLIVGKRGTGYFFTEDKEMVDRISENMAGTAVRSFLREMHALGLSDRQILDLVKNMLEGVGNNGTANGQSN